MTEQEPAEQGVKEILDSIFKELDTTETPAPPPRWYRAETTGWADDTANAPVVSDGGSSSYYQIPAHSTELRHVISHKGMSFARGNCFKALYRLGEKAGVDIEYDLNKLEFFVKELREMHDRGDKL